MKYLKNYVVSVLLFTFVFITFHDYMGIHTIDAIDEVSIETSYNYDVFVKADVTDIIHDSMHSFFIASFVETIPSMSLMAYTKPYDIQLPFISQVLQVPQPPPLT